MLPEWPHYSPADNDHIVVTWKRKDGGGGGKRNPPFAMAKSCTCATARGVVGGGEVEGGLSPDHFFKLSKQSLPTVNKMKMSKAFRQLGGWGWGGVMGFRG